MGVSFRRRAGDRGNPPCSIATERSNGRRAESEITHVQLSWALSPTTARCPLANRRLCVLGEESLRPLQIGHHDRAVKARRKRGEDSVHFRDLALSTP